MIHRKPRHLWLCLLVSTLSFPVFADNGTVEPLTLPEAIRHTLDRHPHLQSFRHRLQAQQGRIEQAGLSSNPELELAVEDILGSGEFSGADRAQTTLSIRWALDGRLTDKRSEVASREKSLIENERNIERLDVAAQTARYFLTALANQERMTIAKRGITLAQTTVKEIQQRVKAGRAPLAEALRAKADLAKRELRLMDIEHELESALHQLAAQWGNTEPTFNTLAGALMAQPDIVSYEQLRQQVTDNPDMEKFLTLDRIAEAELELAKIEYKKPWQISTGVKRFESSDDYGLVAGISIPLGLRNRNQGRITELKASQIRYQAEAEAARIRIETSLFVLYQQLRHSIHLGDALKKEVIPRLEQALAETRKAYELGRYSYLEWLSVQNDVLEAQAALLDARLAAHLNTVAIERLTGAHLTTVNE